MDVGDRLRDCRTEHMHTRNTLVIGFRLQLHGVVSISGCFKYEFGTCIVNNGFNNLKLNTSKSNQIMFRTWGVRGKSEQFPFAGVDTEGVASQSKIALWCMCSTTDWRPSAMSTDSHPIVERQSETYCRWQNKWTANLCAEDLSKTFNKVNHHAWFI